MSGSRQSWRGGFEGIRLRLVPIAVALSFLVSAAIIGAALWAESGMPKEFASYGASQWGQAAGVLLPLIAVCGWPWPASFFRGFNGPSRGSSVVFAVAGVLLAALFYIPTSNTPSEGKGYYVIFFLLVAWVAFPLSLLVRSDDQ